MFSNETKLTNELGLHARPASRFVQKANEFESEITVKKENGSANAKSILEILKLGVSQGTTIAISAEGTDEEEAVSALITMVDERLEAIEEGMES